MKRHFCLAALPCLLGAFADEAPRKADITKLQTTPDGAAEAARLAGCDGKKTTLSKYRFLPCPPADKSDPLYLLLTELDYHFESSYRSPDEYDDDDLESLFRTKTDDASPPQIPSIFTPSLELIEDSVLLVFDDRGKELTPFGGNNYISHGYVLDFNRDGVLERADSMNYSVKEASGYSVESFKLQTIEREPKTLLEVIFNWHPRRADDANDWAFKCFDDEGDGWIEIAFGPEESNEAPSSWPFVFRWNPDTGSYTAGEIPERSHLRVVEPDESYADIAGAGGLGYPLLGPEPDQDTPFNPKADTPNQQSPYAFESLKDKSDEELAAFFSGKRKRDPHFDGPEDAVPNRIPERFWELPAKQAALALADANRTPSHQAGWQIAVDDRNDIKPPSSGWLIHNWSSSGCYSLSTHMIGVNFGVENPVLVVLEYNSIGVVGRNRWADQPAHAARFIPLGKSEARFLADTIFWLDRVRAWRDSKPDETNSSSSSTADGFASVDFLPSSAPPYQVAASTVWATSSISGHWQREFDRSIFVNLTEHLLGDALPAHLGDRWKVAPEIGHHSLTTPTDQRLKDRVDADARQQLEETLKGILERDPPAPILRKIVHAAGEEALVGLRPELLTIQSSLREPNAEDEEFEQLRDRFKEDHFGTRLRGERDDDADALKRLEILREQRRFDPANLLQEPLDFALKNLDLARDPAHLIQAVVDETPQATWALRQLRRTDIDAWADLVSDGFSKVGLPEKKSIFDTLAAGHPQRAKALAESLTPKERKDLIIEVSTFHQKHGFAEASDDLPILIGLVRDRTKDMSQRSSAMRILSGSKLSDPQREELHALLKAEIEEPQSERLWNTRATAISALTELPGTSSDVELIASRESFGYDGFEVAVDAVAQFAEQANERSAAIARIIRARFQGNPERADGMMNNVFFAALAWDVRDLEDDISSFATESSQFADGSYALSASTAFKGPKGERYHAAREVSALWSEKDPLTEARMWVFFVCAHPFQFDGEYAKSRTARELRKRAASHIRKLPVEARRATIESALTRLPIGNHLNEVTPWLRSLY